MKIKEMIFYQGMIFHAVCKNVDFERAYYSLKRGVIALSAEL
jgi:hypothetical protein